MTIIPSAILKSAKTLQDELKSAAGRRSAQIYLSGYDIFVTRKKIEIKLDGKIIFQK